MRAEHDQHHPHQDHRHQERARAQGASARSSQRIGGAGAAAAAADRRRSSPARRSSSSERLRQSGETLDDLLPEAFAVVREAGRRVLNMRHFDVQLIGGMALHRGMIAEMKTGEGKTLVATLAAYLNALAGKGVHVVTVNDYLAKRDSEWMGRHLPLPRPLGGRHPAPPGRPRAAGRLRGRHHLRHQQRVRLRLPARQHEVRPRQLRPARPPLRGRGRGGLDPDRRGAHAAHHQRPRRGVDRQVLPHQRRSSPS